MGIFAHTFSDGVRPPRDLTVSQWADEFGYLPPSVAEPGRYRVDRTPYARAILDDLTPNNGVNQITFMASAQVSKTEIMNQAQGYYFHYNPQSFLVYLPTVDAARNYSKTKISPMIDSNPNLKPIFSKNDNNILEKEFKGYVALYKGGNSGNSYRMISVPIAFLDEGDSLDLDIDGEGDPITLIKNRLQSFGRRAKLFLSSTPTIRDFSLVEKNFLLGDQRRYYVPCPHCNSKQVLKFPNLKYTKDPFEEKKSLRGSVYYECEVCQKRIDEHHKTWMLANGEWIAENPNADPTHHSYHICALYSPIGWKSWPQIADQWLEAQDDISKIKAFKNTVLGETYYEQADQPNHKKLMVLAEPYKLYEVNEKAVSLFAGADVQDNRLVAMVVAFGEDCEQWVVAYEEIFGDPGQPQVWEQLNQLIRRPFKHAGGFDMHIKGCALDTQGHYTQNAYDFVRRNQDRFFAVKGASHDIGYHWKAGKSIDTDTRTGKKLDNPLTLYLVNTFLNKQTLYNSLNNMLNNNLESGANVIHFSKELPERFYEMLVSERLIRRMHKGMLLQEFVKPNNSTRNEALDCYVYLHALAYSMGVRNLYGSEYKKIWKLNVFEKKNKVVAQPNASSAPAKSTKPKKQGWINTNGFSIT